jgi:hypothetical protein
LTADQRGASPAWRISRVTWPRTRVQHGVDRTGGHAARTPSGGLAGGAGAVSPLRERRAGHAGLLVPVASVPAAWRAPDEIAVGGPGKDVWPPAGVP